MEKCICGKEFKDKKSLSAHHAHCKIFQEEKERNLKILKIEEENYQYVCKCGRRFKNIYGLGCHGRFCNLYDYDSQKTTKYLNKETQLYICECGYNTSKAQSLNAHFSHCKLHREVNKMDNSKEHWDKRNHTNLGHMLGWEKFSKDEINNIFKKAAKTLKKKYDDNILIAPFKDKKHTEEVKRIMSEKRKQNLENGKGNHWICPNIKRSYAEEYFYNSFKNANINIENNIWVEHYCLDFVYNGKYFEVDGEQHYTEEGIEKDKRRTEFLEKKGYILIDRCRWKNFIKLSDIEKQNYIDNIIQKFT